MQQTRADLNAHLVVIALVVASLLLAILLLPTDAQLGIHLQSDADTRRAQYFLESALRKDGFRREIVIPLAKIALETGQTEMGLAALRHLDPQALTDADHALQSDLLRAGGHKQAYAEALSWLGWPDQSLQAREQLAQLYAEQRLPELQAEVLNDLARERPGDAQLVQRAAHLNAELGNRNRALALLSRLWREQPETFRAADFALLVALVRELDPSDTARRLVEQYLPRFTDSVDRIELAREFLESDRYADALALLEPLLRTDEPDRRALQLWARILVLQGRAGEAASRLRGLLTSTPGLGEVVTMLCEVALSQGDYRGALDIANHAELRAIAPRVLLWLASTAAAVRDRDALRRILPLLDDDALGQDPVTSVYLHDIAGLRVGARRWAATARTSTTLTAEQALWLAELLLGMGERGQAAAVLRDEVARHPVFDDNALRIAHLWWRTGAVIPALQAFSRTESHGPGVLAGKALLLAADGRVDTALALVDASDFAEQLSRSTARQQPGMASTGRGSQAAKDWLSALAQVADRRHAPLLAVYAYRGQLALRPGQRPVQWALAQAWLAADHPLEALAVARDVPQPYEAQEAATWRAILLAAWRAKAPVRDELVATVVPWLQTQNLQKAEPESWVHILLDAGATREAMPFVAQLAALRGGAWSARQIALLTELGATAEVQALWRAKGLDAHAPRQERLDAANALLLSGNRVVAQQILQQVADRDPADSPVVQELLRLWGPRPGPDTVLWLETRARLATGAGRRGWLEHLLWVGAHEVVSEILGQDPGSTALAPVAVEAFARGKQWKLLANWADAHLPTLSDPDVVERVAVLLAAHGQKHPAVAAYARLVALDPRNADALKWLAQASSAHPAEAERYWSASFAVTADAEKGSWRDRVAYAEALAAGDKRADSAAQLDIALRLLATQAKTAQDRNLQGGRLLARLGRHSDAVPLLEQALEATPCDDSLRADLVASLLAIQATERAAARIDPPAQCGGVSP